MKVSISSREMMLAAIKEGISSNTAVISFADAEDEFISFPKEIDVLYVAFYDVRPYTVSKHHYGGILPQAKQIAEFICKEIDSGKDIICQCDYGISRSAGCAAAIMEMWEGRGIDIFADYRYSPNQFVYNKVLKELKNVRIV